MLRLVRPVEAAGRHFGSSFRYGCRGLRSNGSARSHDPLNILFCGADEFSIYSLRALRDLQSKKPDKIAAIDVVCRPDKYVGRGLRRVQEVPIKAAATQLGLNLHQIDTFKGWQPPASINLVIAVSFGLLVPARILNGAKYGGLNVHPSLLPDLRGPAPIVYALLKRRSHTGVSLQTMHPTRFDHGTILCQTPEPGIPISEDSTPRDLIETLGPIGAELLCQGIEDGLFVDSKDIRPESLEPNEFDHAPKITPEDRHINWETWTAEEILLRDRILGRLWDIETYGRCFDSNLKRVAFEGPWTKEDGATTADKAVGSPAPGQIVIVRSEGTRTPKLGFRTCDQQIVVPSAATIDGEKKGTGIAAMVNHLSR